MFLAYDRGNAQLIPNDWLIGTWTASTSGDVTAPILSSPTGTATGYTTADGTVSTDEGNGTLYWYASTSITPPSIANHKSGVGAAAFGNQAVTATGVQNVSVTGLTASTTYYLHYLHTDSSSNDSNQATSASFTTYTSYVSPSRQWGSVMRHAIKRKR